METINKRVKAYVLWEIQNYPSTRHQLEAYRAQMSSAAEPRLDMPGELLQSSVYIKRAEATAAAIEKVLRSSAEEQREAVDLIYWKGTHNAAGAGMKIGASERTVYRWIDHIVQDIARELGLCG